MTDSLIRTLALCAIAVVLIIALFAGWGLNG